MPIYTYQCVGCQSKEDIVAAPDDATAVCASCGGLALRLDPEIFEPIDRPRLKLCPGCGEGKP